MTWNNNNVKLKDVIQFLTQGDKTTCDELIIKKLIMKDEAIKSIEQAELKLKQAEKELKAAKEALKENKITFEDYAKYKGEIYSIIGWSMNKDNSTMILRKHLTHLNTVTEAPISECKPSTKEAFDKQNEIIPVPDCIKFYAKSGNRIGIVFNNDNQYLSLGVDVYNVSTLNNSCFIRSGGFKLTKCERSDLKAGDVAFRCDNYEFLTGYLNPNKKITYANLDYLDDIESYCVILDEIKYVLTEDDGDIVVESSDFDHWYKVEKI